jgi:hypothetical protein
MGRRSLLRAISFGCAALLTSSAWATTIVPGQGGLSVNQGQGFQPVNSRVDANVGDAVMVGPGGAATVVYSDGCTVNVQPGAVTTIAPLSPCASGSYAQDNDNRDSMWGYVLGAGALAVFGVGIYELTQKNNNNNGHTRPASP